MAGTNEHIPGVYEHSPLTIKNILNPDNPSSVVYNVNMDAVMDHGGLPSIFETQDNLVSISWESCVGDFFDSLICRKSKLIMRFDCIDEYALNELYYKAVTEPTGQQTQGSGGIRGIIDKEKARFFEINVSSEMAHLDLDLQYMTSGVYYLAATTGWKLLGYNNGTRWYTGELHWIQVTGHKFVDNFEELLDDSSSNSNS